MENLGVVPLFLLAAFLFLPLVLALRFLLLVVIFVFDTIRNSQNLKYLALLHLPDGRGIVKPIKKISLFMAIFFSLEVLAQTEKETLVIARGEQLELPTGNMQKYSLGNKEILSLHFDAQNKVLYLKGKSIGFTDLMIWMPKEKKQYLVYVISKREHLEHAKIVELFPPPLWKVNFIGESVSIAGELTNQRQWTGLLALKLKNITLDLEDVVLDKNFKRKLLTNIYQELKLLGLEKFSCFIKQIPHITCFSHQDLTAEQIHQLQLQYPGLIWSRLQKFKPLGNVRVKIKLLSFDYQQGEDWQKGFDYLKGHLHEIFDLGLWAMLKRNPINFEKYWNKVSVLAEPEFTLIPDTEAKFNIGSEIPYYRPTSETGLKQLEWKFAGLSVEMKIIPSPDPEKLKVSYHTGLSAPSGEQINGHEQRAELFIEKETDAILFDLSYKATTQSKNSLPFWSKIPILSSLFGSESEHQSDKKILAIIHIKDLINE